VAFSNTYTFGFAATICVVCSLALASLSMGLRDLQEDNRRRDVQGNILKALGVEGAEGNPPAGEEIDELWKTRVELRVIDGSGKPVTDRDLNADGATDQLDVDVARASVKGTENTPEILSVYIRKDGDKEGAYAIPVYGVGLWGPISGYVALDPAGKEVSGVTFFAPKETPGLGAEITKAKFTEQWTGKKVTGKGGEAKSVRVVKGEAKVLCPNDLDHCVDGVSGATITCRGVDSMVAEALDFYDPYLKQIRGG
jgi:Na+-transporting NADH:ubiquinone oxidoreductase subunit C